MLPENDYLQFSRAVSKILKDCFVAIDNPNKEPIDLRKEFDLSINEVTFTCACSTLTKENTYIFHKEKTISHKQELLDLCKSLPKLKTVVTGTAGTIAYTDLLPDEKCTLTALKRYCMHADKFIAMLSINGIGYPKDMVGTDNFQAAPINLMYKYKDQVNPDAE
ncbi:MAG: hypothetical protein IJ410_06420 [Oscillospiraceae bacterium]|nr:hypothetical protein [Oscillospiraceae bacterium]